VSEILVGRGLKVERVVPAGAGAVRPGSPP
jgi:hypothetical protein